MRLLTVLLFFLLPGLCFCQDDLLDFSDISGRERRGNLVKVSDGYVFDLRYSDTTSGGYRHSFYKISEAGTVVDSTNLHGTGATFLGMPFNLNGNFSYLGTSFSDDNQRYYAAEYDDDFDIIRAFQSPVFGDTLKGFLYFYQTTDGHANRTHEYSIYNDTIFAAGRYLLSNNSQQILGQGNYYFKGNMNGEIYVWDKPLLGSFIYNVFFVKNKMYLMGSINDPDNPWLPRAVGRFNQEGEFEEGWVFDDAESGEFPWGSVGGAIDDRLYFSYLARDPDLSVCPERNVAIDIRDTLFNILHRFEISECGYYYAGNMPFTKGGDGSIYFQAVKNDYRGFIIQKYTPDMELIWSKAYDTDNELFIVPIEMVPTEDGGVLVHVKQELNGFSVVRLFKFSPEGDIVSSTQFATDVPAEASVLYPNPCRDQVHYSGKATGRLQARVHSIDGRINRLLPFVNGQLDTSTLPAGLYAILIFETNKPNQILHRQTLVKMP